MSDASLDLLREAFGERIAIATWRHLDVRDTNRVKGAIEASARHDIPIVASTRPLYHHRSRKPLSDVVHCIRLGTTLDAAGTKLAPNAEADLKTGEAVARLFPKHPEWIGRTVEIADRCTFSLGELRYHFPFEYGDKRQTPDANLKIAVQRGLVERYPMAPPTRSRRRLRASSSSLPSSRLPPILECPRNRPDGA